MVFKILGHWGWGDLMTRDMSSMYVDIISRIGQSDHLQKTSIHNKSLPYMVNKIHVTNIVCQSIH